jgi:3-dehydrosphinganine reductase
MDLGIESGHMHITADLITSLFRASTRGSAPKNNWILDGIYDLIAYVCPLSTALPR